MAQAPDRQITYIVAFDVDADIAPHLLRERYLLQSTEPPAVISFAEGFRNG